MSGKQKKPVQIHSVPFKSVQFTGAIIPYTETMCPVTTTMRTQKKVRNSMEGVPRRGTTAVDVEKMKASDRAARVAQAPQQHRRLCSRATPASPRSPAWCESDTVALTATHHYPGSHKQNKRKPKNQIYQTNQRSDRDRVNAPKVPMPRTRGATETRAEENKERR